MDHQAFAQLLGNYGEFVGAIAVVVTLGYLAVQVRHSRDATQANTRSMEMQSYQAWQAANVQINVAFSHPLVAEAAALGNSDSRNLTQASHVSHAMIHLAMMQMAQSTDYLYRAGLLDRELWEAEMNRAAGVLAQTGVRQWWDAGGNTQLAPSFVKLIESRESNLRYWTWEPERGYVGSDSV